MKNQEMIKYEKAYEIAVNSAFQTGTEDISFTGSLNRILASEVISDIDLPPFNKASVDGFACRKIDLNNELEVLETIPAGKEPDKRIGKCQCSRIMTGGVLPDGADCVIMVEDAELLPSGKVRFTGTDTKENYAVKGEDVRRGDVVMKPGTRIRPQDIAVMAAVGHTRVTVRKIPPIAVISSGSELVEPSELPAFSQIRNSNAFQLMAQAERSGFQAKYYGIAKDDKEETFALVSKAIAENDIVLITGGVSVGDFDFVPEVLEKAGVSIKFTRVAVQPGKPTTFGIHSKALVFGLPGNPVSSFMMFEMIVKPVIFKMMGYDWHPVEFSMPLGTGYGRKSAGRMGLVPVKIDSQGFVNPVDYHGSAHISALHGSDGIIMVPVGEIKIESGTLVKIRMI